MLRTPSQWLGGYNPSILRDENAEATHAISLTGGLVGVATIVTAANWGIAGFSLIGGTTAWIVGLVSAFAGATFALSVDRPGAFALDAQAPGRGRKLAMLGARVGACLLISAVTTEAVLPLWQGQDGARIALEQREEKDATRAKTLNERFELAALRTAGTETNRKAEVAWAAVRTIPPAILKMEADSKACARMLFARHSVLMASGVSETVRRRQLASLSVRCSALANTARRELTAYNETAQRNFSDAVTAQLAARATLAAAEKTVNGRLSEAEQIEKEAITSTSSIVGDSVLSTSPTARRRAIGIYLLLLLIELSPLGFKWLGGASVPGTRIAVDHELAVARHFRRRDDAIHADETRLTVRDSVDEMLDAALRSPIVRDRLRTTFEAGLEPLVAFDIYRRIITETEELHELRRAAARRCPDASDSINGLADAIVEDLAVRMRDRSAAWRPSAEAA